MKIPFIQNYFIQKKIENLKSQNYPYHTNKIKNILLVIDESHQDYKTKIIFKIKEMGINENNLTVLIYTQNLEKNKKYEFTTFSNESFSNFGIEKSEELIAVLNQSFDLLITFYEDKNLLLEYIVHRIKCGFKVGLSKSQNQFFHLTVNSSLENVKIYLSETFKYLKILNKL
ncbi:MAG: DUF6913 domain-containing protein [Flavobacterium sp.]|jgi:hypothetical protein